MTAAQHEATAKTEDAASKEQGSLYDLSQNVSGVGFTGSFAGVSCPGYGTIACFPGWTSVQNPTARHLADSRRHAELAAQHRAASEALREAEDRACKNVPEGDKDISPFYHREDIVSAGPLAQNVVTDGESSLQSDSQRLVGAEVVFGSLPGMTAEWLQRVVDCHLARNAVMGPDQMMSYCPLAVPHVKASVRSVGNGFAVDVSSENEGSVKEILSRSEALTGKRPPKVVR